MNGYFSSTVSEADHKFSAACAARNIVPEPFTHPLQGPAGEPLRLSAATFGPDGAARRLLIVSATHGIEGYAGCAIQTGWLTETGPAALPPDTSVTLVHALNPWGMAWNRRENEDNVDLFRNLIYCDHPSEPDPLFDAVDDAMDLAHWPERNDPERRRRYRALIERHGVDRLVAAIRRGQHHRPQAMTYHGNGPTWSKRMLDRVVAGRLAGAAQIAVIDLHTGFGPYGQGTVMSYDPPGSERHSRVSRWFEGDIYTPGADADIPDHRGRLPFAWIEGALPGASVTAAILEFGTFPPEDSRDCFPANHHFHLFGDPLSAEGRAWGERYRRFSYPQEPTWCDAVFARGKAVLDTVLAGLDRWV